MCSSYHTLHPRPLQLVHAQAVKSITNMGYIIDLVCCSSFTWVSYIYLIPALYMYESIKRTLPA
jgi:hypothetical protein